MNEVPVITVDGPGGVGKGTLCSLLAEQTGWNLLDSGAIYRIFALAALKKQVALDDEVGLKILSTEIDVSFEVQNQQVRTFLNHELVSDELRTEETGQAASIIASIPIVRQSLFDLQRQFKQMPGLIADGRDMGTVVFPEAKCKLFLTASVAERAKRRQNQLSQQNVSATIEQLTLEISARDDRDMNRSVAPLKPAEDALLLDTTGLAITEVLEKARLFARKKGLL